MKAIFLAICLLQSAASTVQPAPPVSPPAANSEGADFAQLARYRDANLKLRQSGTRVVFLGDSILDYWGTRAGVWFPHNGWIDRGIGGQTTAQLLLRMRADALDLHPAAIFVEGGSNDMRMGFTPEAIRDNMLSMGQIAEANSVKVFVAAMTPTCDCFKPLTGLRTVESIRQLNRLLEAMCKDHGWTWVDLNAPLAGPNGQMRQELTFDGVHPNDAGYALLALPVEKALAAYR